MTSERERVVIKIGSSSVTGSDGGPNVELLGRLAGEIKTMHEAGTEVVVVSSGAVAAGWAAIGRGAPRPTDLAVLQAVSAVGQHRLMSVWATSFASHDLTVGQVLLSPYDFADRTQYLHARQTLGQLLALGVVPIVNENDAVADDEIRFGDNDRLAALVAHLVSASRLVMLTDAPGLLSADPRLDADASLIEEVTQIDRSLEALAGGPGEVGSGGMASKLAAARIATWSGVEAVIADARQAGALEAIQRGVVGVGTRFHARPARLSARKLWIAFALAPTGRLIVDSGARNALLGETASLLLPGIVGAEGNFVTGDAVEVVDRDGALVAKGLVRRGADDLADSGRGDEEGSVIIHRDDLVVLTTASDGLA